MRVSAVLLSGLIFVCMAGPTAHARHLHHGYHGHHKHRPAAKLRYGGAPARGFWRPGPSHGYRFGFATYKGDPFGKDDYFDGGNCYYRKHHDYCVPGQIFTGFRHPE